MKLRYFVKTAKDHPKTVVSLGLMIFGLVESVRATYKTVKEINESDFGRYPIEETAEANIPPRQRPSRELREQQGINYLDHAIYIHEGPSNDKGYDFTLGAECLTIVKHV